MADVNKPKLQVRQGLSLNGDNKTASPGTKLLINHGKPNFTIQRSPKVQNGHVNPMSPTPTTTCSNFQNNNKDLVVKSTTFNGVFRPSNFSAATKKTFPQNGNGIINNGTDNEMAKVVLRRANFGQTETREGEDDGNVPEFIRRQRRIQERLANQNILDFENRRSGYFTQVLISPSSPNRQSFVETMASPAIKPGLEIPPPTTQHDDIKEEPTTEEHHEEKIKDTLITDSVIFNGQVEEEEVAKAIEEVNKAVEGEDDDKTELEEDEKTFQVETVAVSTLQNVEEAKSVENVIHEEEIADLENTSIEGSAAPESDITFAAESTQENGYATVQEELENPKSSDVVNEVMLENDHSKMEPLGNGITISHVNGLNGPCIPPPDPRGEKGVNFEPKTVVSFSQELGNDDNKYPDTVKVIKDSETLEDSRELEELKKLKFEIKANDVDIEVKPVLVAETA